MTSISEPVRRVACLECRRMKTKCTGGTVCVRCVRLFRPCCYEATERKSRSERLEDKLQKLEHEIETLESRRTGAHPHQRGKDLGPSKEHAGSSTAPIQHSLPIFPEYQVEASDTSPGIVSQQDYEAGYGSAIPRTIIETSLYRWDTNTDLPPELKGYLVRIFLPFRSHYLFYVDPSKFLRRVLLNPLHPRSIHPVLLNAIYVVACSIGGGSWSHFEPIFLVRTRTHLEHSLALADRLTHFMWASVILGQYYGLADRQLEAFNTMSPSINFAVGFGLHRNHRALGQGGPLGLAANQIIETDDPMNLWNAMYLTDLSIASPAQNGIYFDTLLSGQAEDPLQIGVSGWR
ncbi:hypothetical protein BS47DRAFT_1054082 [Hydnum rufescens UP504]|uniref:Zn(2)-C6 fungal-type domain-containing protein n=1 Tax=Hydnum rufescens UP504 TaxID=1448309 RepID=A0A9P6AVH0_9AGAM|nr:hypothetical protein BS47DRAFT_1054082 [Hydnum rufescens UP504]